MGFGRRGRRVSAIVAMAMVVVIGDATPWGRATRAETGTSSPAPSRFEHVMTIGSPGDGPGEFRYVEDMALTDDGRLLATDAGHAYVQVFDKRGGAFLSRFGGRDDAGLRFEKPEGIAVDPRGHVFVADYATGLVWELDRDFALVGSFGEYGSGPGQNFKSEFIGIAGGRLYLPEAGNHRVDVFDLDGVFLFSFGGQGDEPGRMNNPEAAKIGPDGRVYVSDLKNHRIQIFDADGRFLEAWGRVGDEVGALNAPTGVGFDARGNVYVGEMGNDRVQVFDPTGVSIAVLGRRGAVAGEFSGIHGVLVDPETGWVYVADTGNHRIQVFRPLPPEPAAGTRPADATGR